MAKKFFLWMSLCFFIISAWAVSSPVTTLQDTTNRMTAALKANQGAIKNNPKVAEQLARKLLLPKVDMLIMSRLALGPSAWRAASDSERKQFIAQFTEMVVGTYAKALSAYTDQKIVYLPVRESKSSNWTQVPSKIYQSGGGPPISVNYRLVLREGQWKVYDFSVDGISMVQSFRSQFAQQLRQGGMSQLLKTMAKHNAKQ